MLYEANLLVLAHALCATHVISAHNIVEEGVYAGMWSDSRSHAYGVLVRHTCQRTWNPNALSLCAL